MHGLVKILSDDDGETVDDPKWCLVNPTDRGGPATLCGGEYFGFGESECTYETRERVRGGITCPQCLADLKTLKAIRL